MIWPVIGIVTVVLAMIPTLMLAVNLSNFQRAPKTKRNTDRQPTVSVLIPARDEADSIADCLREVLANEGVEMEVLVLDDRSTDGTDEVVSEIASHDSRVRLHRAPSLPAGWCGKQHACHVLARHARNDRLMWIDADIRLTPDAIERTVAFMDRSNAPLVSGFPYQVCRTWAEALVVPLIHIVLLGYLPLDRMRKSTSPGFAAGCGQMFMADRNTYHQVGGHAAIRATLHDGIMLPRTFRQAGHATDIFDAQDIARCRMYDSPAAVWQGFAKNATEGLATSVGIWVWSVLLFGGHVLPWLFAAIVFGFGVPADFRSSATVVLAGVALLLAVTSNTLAWWRFGHPWLSLLLRPIGVMMLLGIQWYAYSRKLIGQPVSWRGRSYAAS
ncbi:glycosyltransferase family 2 protein [Phycisphaerales bacterium AB-hyl4]|uniref:Glycosyltransferase family 2 protein n=1 Tax=Natronomicrosphaera hydrolytica TaxID=3242702 RepID=A0ABV4U304_9BACT